MTDPCILPDCAICAPAAEAWVAEQRAMLAALWEAAVDKESAPWDERTEAQMSFHAETFDHETGQSRRLRRTR